MMHNGTVTVRIDQEAQIALTKAKVLAAKRKKEKKRTGTGITTTKKNSDKKTSTTPSYVNKLVTIAIHSRSQERRKLPSHT